jgi:signal transduction histidine kinase
MPQMEQIPDAGAVGRRRVEAVVHTLAALGCRGETLAEVAHDARNMVTALGLYCDLLEEPGVLAVPFAHYGNELRLVAAASRRLVEKLVALDHEALAQPQTAGFEAPASDGWTANGLPDAGLQQALDSSLERSVERSFDRRRAVSAQRNTPGQGAAAETGLGPGLSPGFGPAPGRSRRWDSIFAEPIQNLAAELLGNRNLLAALAGPGIAVTVDTEGGASPVRLTAEDLTRMLVNLVKNAAEAMPSGGRVHITLSERSGMAGASTPSDNRLVMAVEDNGPGIAEGALERIFESGFTTHLRNAGAGGWPSAHRGLGLAITRSIVEAAGGRIAASNRTRPTSTGARFEIELPVRAL